MALQKPRTREQRRARRDAIQAQPAPFEPCLSFVTYVEPSRYWFAICVATGEGTKPTPDGGPWSVEYTVPAHERHRLDECSRTAEFMLWRMIGAHAADVLREAEKKGWVTR